MPADHLGILLISGGHERAHYAFLLAAAAAAMGRKVTVFATNTGCRALAADWSKLEDAARDDRVREKGVAGLDELREAAVELDVVLLACEAGLRMVAMAPAELLPGVDVAGAARFLEACADGQILTL